MCTNSMSLLYSNAIVTLNCKTRKKKDVHLENHLKDWYLNGLHWIAGAAACHVSALQIKGRENT